MKLNITWSTDAPDMVYDVAMYDTHLAQQIKDGGIVRFEEEHIRMKVYVYWSGAASSAWEGAR